MLIKDEIILKDWLYALVIPISLKPQLDAKISDDLRGRVIYIENDCEDIWAWAEKVYQTVERGVGE